MKPVLLKIDGSEIIFKIGVEKMTYKKDINSFIEDSGLTITNINFPIKGYYLRLADYGTTFSCGNIINNIFLALKKDKEDSLIIIDFNNVEEISKHFLEKYTKFLLETSNKIITINMSKSISNNFSFFIEENIKDPNEIENEEESEE